MNDVSKFITIIRPEFMSFCLDACRSAALNHLLYRIASKCKDQPKGKIQAGEILWYGKNELITEEMSNAWGVCKVRKEVNELVNMGLFGRTSNPEWGADRTKHFFFGTKQCTKFLEYLEEHGICFVHFDLVPVVKHLIYSSNANDKSIKCLCEMPENPEMSEANDISIKCISSIHQMETIDISNANDISIEAITKIPTKNTTKIPTKNTTKRDNEDISAHADSTHSDVSLDDLYASLPIPATYREAMIYLKPHGPHDEIVNAVEVINLAQKLWAEAHENLDDLSGDEDTVKAPVVKLPPTAIGETTHVDNSSGSKGNRHVSDSLAPHVDDSRPLPAASGEDIHRHVDNSPTDGDKSGKGEQDGQRVKGARKPKKAQDESMTKRIAAVFTCLDELEQERLEEPGFTWSRTKVARAAIETLLTSWQRLTKEQVQSVYRFMVNAPASDDGFQWSDHMSVKAFCNNFSSEFSKMTTKARNGNGNHRNGVVTDAQAIAAQLARGLMPSAEQLRNERY